jgi:hypothetical protein
MSITVFKTVTHYFKLFCRDSDDEQREGKGLWKASAFQGLSVIVDLNNNDSVGVGKKMRTGLKVSAFSK